MLTQVPTAHEPATDPEQAILHGARGTPVLIQDQTWLFADYVPEREPIWDEIYDRSARFNKCPEELIRSASIRLLCVNYDLEPGRAADLILAAPIGELVTAVEAALYGPSPEHTSRGWSQWVECSLRSNNIDPETVPPYLINPLLEYLEEMKKLIPAREYICSLRAAVERQEWLSKVKPRTHDVGSSS